MNRLWLLLKRFNARQRARVTPEQHHIASIVAYWLAGIGMFGLWLCIVYYGFMN